MTRNVGGRDHLITTAPSLIKCPRCHRPVLAATVGGIDRHVDTATLNPTGELAALLAGRSSFELHGEVLVRRGPEKIRAGHPGAPVLADHSCDPVPDSHVEHAWTAAAMALVIQAVGGVVVGGDRTSSTTPPF